jgi:hypothetical protein
VHGPHQGIFRATNESVGAVGPRFPQLNSYGDEDEDELDAPYKQRTQAELPVSWPGRDLNKIEHDDLAYDCCPCVGNDGQTDGF